jgi:NAD+ synthase (glutamine-hydrolysing)
MVKIALAQINPIVGNLRYNYVKIKAFISAAKKKGADLVAFPELALTGYPPEDLLFKNHFIDENMRFLNLLRKECEKITALVGFVGRNNGVNYNSCALIRNKKIEDIYQKNTLGNGVLNEKRYFSAGKKLPLYAIGGFRFAVSICEDICKEEFINSLRREALDFIINISASPFHLGKVSIRQKVLSYAATRTKSCVFYCNLVGGQDELVFDGTSKVVSVSGEIAASAKRFSEDLFVFNLNKDRGKKKKSSSMKATAGEAEEAFLALRLGLYDYVRKNGFKKVVVGVSGGIDSAVVATLAKEALGSNNVFGLIMPSPYTSRATFCDAKRVCENLGVRYAIVDIEDILSSYFRKLRPNFKGKKSGKTEENLQARIRGNILMAFSNKFGYLVLNTGNKSETSCGYCTLYGDMVGGFGVLSDVYKTVVYRIAGYINKINSKQIIPRSAIKRVPSAELRPNQKDTDNLPPYELLDPVLKLYVEKHLSSGEIIRRGFKGNLVRKVIKLVDSNEYKRRQAPIGIKITPCAFGKDRRMPITNKFSQ